MDAEEEKRTLKEELDRLRTEVEAGQGSEPSDANRERQQQIIRRLADLGVQLG
ncbi:hypothetical protein [Lichenifustis flavocetrariae]|uniref:Uncharacterized protein n=1 Tax=Lichenifustis flavocetrariae TaxID=2949735 RepID=A0AA41YZ05_9HYPH|nr:hypothetical protein [Lichenifustis flavocetrariae]MCW6509703.1 hypothetical protein [Lichenifustis flavocetrariae]